MATLNRKQFLGGLGCAAAGTVVGAYLPRALVPDYSKPLAHPAPKSSRPVAKSPAPINPIHGGEVSYAQCGEDLNVKFTFRLLRKKWVGEEKLTYLDIGAHHPMEINNTYLFYKEGFRGVLVEPNGAYCQALRKVRPEDTTLEAGIGTSDAKEADYYLMNASALNTFSQEQAQRLEAESQGRFKIEAVRKVPLLNINDVMQQHFHGAPWFISIDTEGLDLDILKTVDFTRYRPKVLCVETLVTNTTRDRPEIAQYMASQNYTARGGSIVNTIFIDNNLLM